MRVEFQKNDEPVRDDADLFALGVCLGITVGEDTYRIALTPSQWKLLSKSAANRAEVSR